MCGWFRPLVRGRGHRSAMSLPKTSGRDGALRRPRRRAQRQAMERGRWFARRARFVPPAVARAGTSQRDVPTDDEERRSAASLPKTHRSAMSLPRTSGRDGALRPPNMCGPVGIALRVRRDR